MHIRWVREYSTYLLARILPSNLQRMLREIPLHMLAHLLGEFISRYFLNDTQYIRKNLVLMDYKAEFEKLCDKYERELQDYTLPKNTIKGKIRWQEFKLKVAETLADELDKKCNEFKVIFNDQDLRNEANSLYREFKSRNSV